MRITGVSTAALRGNFEWILVRVATDEGVIGLGECYWGAGVETVVRRLAPVVMGEDPHNVDWLYQKMIRGMSGAGSTGGTALAAISGVELALWDLKGQALGTPIYNLLGGRYRERIRVYADCGHGQAPTRAAWAERALHALEGGFTALKFDIDNIAPQRFASPYHVCTGGAQGWMGGQQCPLSTAEVDLIVNLVSAVREAYPQLPIGVEPYVSTREQLVRLREAGADDIR